MKQDPLKGTYRGVLCENVAKFPAQAPDGVTTVVSVVSLEGMTIAAGSASFAATKENNERRAGLRADAEVRRRDANSPKGIAVGRSSDPWTLTVSQPTQLTLEVTLRDVTLSLPSGDYDQAAQIESYGSFSCNGCPDPDLPITWDYARSVMRGDSFSAAAIPLVGPRTITLLPGYTYRLEADLVTAAGDLSLVPADPEPGGDAAIRPILRHGHNGWASFGSILSGRKGATSNGKHLAKASRVGRARGARREVSRELGLFEGATA